MLEEYQPGCPLHVKRQRLSAWYDGLLDSDERRHLGEHIQSCGACKRCIKEFAMIKNKLATHESTITPEQNWRGLRTRMLMQPAPTSQKPWRAIAAILITVVAVVFISQVLLPRIGRPTSITGIGPYATPSMSNALSDTQAWGKYPKTTVALSTPDGGTFHPTDIIADGKTLLGYVSHPHVVAVSFDLMSVPSGVLQQLTTYTPQAPNDPLYGFISGHYAVFYDVPMTAKSVSHIQYFDLNTHTFLHVNTGTLQLEGSALDHDLLILANSSSDTTTNLYTMNVVTNVQAMIATNVNFQLVSNKSWPYIVYVSITTNQGHLYNLETHEDTQLAQQIQPYVNASTSLRLFGTTLIVSKLIATSSSSVGIELVEADQIDTSKPAVNVLTTAFPQGAFLLRIDQRLILVGIGVNSFAWDRMQQRLVRLPDNGSSSFLVGDYLLYTNAQSVSIIDTRQLPTSAP